MTCPRCENQNSIVKSGIVNQKQRYLCKSCNYYFTVQKSGKRIDNYYIIKAVQLYLEGISLREIENVLGVSHSTINNWIKEFNIKKPNMASYDPAYKIVSFEEMKTFLSNEEIYRDKGIMITELGNKYLIIRWKKTTEF
ncbi:MAG: helix-turn-helix domain-containing protein [Flavobacteriaceae bacterium]|nr:helix-turn-helix domain-containing protein [Flavobacteriaceae bacterium]